MQLYITKSPTSQMAEDANNNNWIFVNINTDIVSTHWNNYTIIKSAKVPVNYLALSAQQRKDTWLYPNSPVNIE